MKKLTILALAIFLFSGVTKAQLRYGIKGGANLSDIITKNAMLDAANMGIHPQVGLLLQYKMGNFSIQPELLYTEKGGTFKGVYGKSNYLALYANLTDQNPDISLVSQQLEIPLNLQFGLKLGKSRVYIQGGPYLSYVLTGRINGENSSYKSVGELYEFNRFDYGLGAGAGVEYKKFQFSAKYDFGFSPVGKETINAISGENFNPFYEMKNRNINVSIGYLF